MPNADIPDRVMSGSRPNSLSASPAPSTTWSPPVANRVFDRWLRRLYFGVGKRTVDVTLAALLLLVFSPVMVVIACWIVLDSPGRAIYPQRRVGHKRREFTIYKFRSMVVHAHGVLERDSELAAEYAVHWKLVRDPRVTRCGGFLRRTSLDELPQLFNVLRGDMSLVGPRPYLAHELNGEFGQHADMITSVKPGITGLWQVSGRSQLAPSERVKLDEVYAKTCGVRLDAFILLKTGKVVFLSHGAH